MENKSFSYQYSAERYKEVENIRKKYMPKEINKLERLKNLDRKVQCAGMIESLCLGVIGVLIFGIGMCFGLKVFAGPFWMAIIFCALGSIIMIPAYPIYKHIARKTKNKLAPEIIQLSEEIIKS